MKHKWSTQVTGSYNIHCYFLWFPALHNTPFGVNKIDSVCWLGCMPYPGRWYCIMTGYSSITHVSSESLKDYSILSDWTCLGKGLRDVRVHMPTKKTDYLRSISKDGLKTGCWEGQRLHISNMGNTYIVYVYIIEFIKFWWVKKWTADRGNDLNKTKLYFNKWYHLLKVDINIQKKSRWTNNETNDFLISGKSKLFL